MKQLYFLSGIPRSGSTVLANILNQHPDIYVSPTSGLLDLIFFSEQNLQKLEKAYVIDPIQKKNIIQSTIDSYYAHRNETIILDKHRGWPRNLPAIARYVPNLKIVINYRPIAEAVTSMIKLMKKNEKKYKKRANPVDDFLRSKNLEINTQNRAHAIFHQLWKEPYENMLFGMNYEKKHLQSGKEKIFHYVNYDDLINDPGKVLSGIVMFLSADGQFTFNFNKIANNLKENDSTYWNMPGLHDVRSSLTKQSWDPDKVLGPELTKHFSQYDFNLETSPPD
nr:sulfotransferase [Desulfobulbaceae bacterium]